MKEDEPGSRWGEVEGRQERKVSAQRTRTATRKKADSLE